MKPCLLLVFLSLSITATLAQSKIADTLQFNKRASRSVNQWVVFPKAPANPKYAYGFIYMDAMAGITFHLVGNFTMGANGNYVVDSAARAKLLVGMYKVRLAPNTKLVSLLPKSHYADLDITGDPTWLKIYQTDTTTLAYNVTKGKHLNTMNDCEYALTYLLKTYKVQQHAPGVEFELAYAYNVLKRFDDAIKVLTPAIKNDAQNVLLIKELGFSYIEQKNIDKAIEVYKNGIVACGEGHPTEKTEMAMNIASGYKYQKNDDLAKEWYTKAKGWAPVNSNEYKQLVQMGY
jgi:tetratricopeptide (TPR) repeat protein